MCLDSAETVARSVYCAEKRYTSTAVCKREKSMAFVLYHLASNDGIKVTGVYSILWAVQELTALPDSTEYALGPCPADAGSLSSSGLPRLHKIKISITL